MHWCAEETAAVMAVIPGLVFLRWWVRGKWENLKLWRARRRQERSYAKRPR